MTNEQFFEKYATQAAIGLVGGSHFIDKTIKKAQKKITKTKQASFFSHVFLIGEKRIDGKQWIIESDLEFHTKQVKLGVQENRIDKYFDEKMFPNVAVLDFKLPKAKQELVLKEALDVVAGRAKYSIREIFGVLFSFSNEAERKKENKFTQENSFICSTFVQHCYRKIDLHFNSSVSLKNMTPEDIFTTTLPHLKEKLVREE